jgi:manganese/zinc/iron transport system permease protein
MLWENIPLVIMTVGALVGSAASVLGTFLVLRQNSMLADAISHAILLGIVVVGLLTGAVSGFVSIVGAALAGILTVALTELLVSSRRVKQDAAIGLVFPLLFAIGVILINLYFRNVHIDIDTVLLGEIAFVWLDTYTFGALEIPRALVNMTVVTLINLLFIVLFYKELKLATFDEPLARALGFSPALLFYGLLSLTSVTAVAAFDAVGSILFIAFVIVPPAAAYLLTDRLWRMLVYSVLIAIAASVSGYYLARRFNVSIGGMMATMTGVFFLLAFVWGPRYGLISQELRRLQQRRDTAERLLVVHLYHHEHARDRPSENTVEALETHLRWRKPQVNRVLRRALHRQLIRQANGHLTLTDTGRTLAQELLEPSRP